LPEAVGVLIRCPDKEEKMKRFLKVAACLGLGSALLVGCQKKTETTTETSKTVEAPATPGATPAVSETTTTTTTSTASPVPTKAP
jgi:hypothetical protein